MADRGWLGFPTSMWCLWASPGERCKAEEIPAYVVRHCTGRTTMFIHILCEWSFVINGMACGWRPSLLGFAFWSTWATSWGWLSGALRGLPDDGCTGIPFGFHLHIPCMDRSGMGNFPCGDWVIGPVYRDTKIQLKWCIYPTTSHGGHQPTSKTVAPLSASFFGVSITYVLHP